MADEGIELLKSPPSVVGRPGYLSEGIHAAPSRQEELHTVGVDPFSSGVQGGQTLLKHTGEGSGGGRAGG